MLRVVTRPIPSDPPGVSGWSGCTRSAKLILASRVIRGAPPVRRAVGTTVSTCHHRGVNVTATNIGNRYRYQKR